MNIKKNASLLIGLTIPIVLIVAVAAAIYIPRLTVQPPQYDFVYTTGDIYNYTARYIVRNGKLVREEIPLDPSYPQPVKDSFSQSQQTFYLHNVHTNQSREISFEEAQKLKLDANRESPDGYSLRLGSSSGVFPFFYGGPDQNSWFLTGHNTSHSVNLKQITNYSNNQLLGWVIQ